MRQTRAISLEQEITVTPLIGRKQKVTYAPRTLFAESTPQFDNFLRYKQGLYVLPGTVLTAVRTSTPPLAREWEAGIITYLPVLMALSDGRITGLSIILNAQGSYAIPDSSFLARQIPLHAQITTEQLWSLWGEYLQTTHPEKTTEDLAELHKRFTMKPEDNLSFEMDVIPNL